MPWWIAVGDGPEDRWSREAFATSTALPDGTYELCGPKVQGNPEGVPAHCLVTHGGEVLPDFPRTFDGMRDALRSGEIEGVVFHHPDGRMAKVKGKDFGFKRAAMAGYRQAASDGDPRGRRDVSDCPRCQRGYAAGRPANFGSDRVC